MGQAEEEEEGEPGSGEGGGDGESVQVEDGGVGREGGEGDADTAPPELVLFRCHRSAVVPKLTLRRGYVEDYDDLLPLLNQDQPVVCILILTIPKSVANVEKSNQWVWGIIVLCSVVFPPCCCTCDCCRKYTFYFS